MTEVRHAHLPSKQADQDACLVKLRALLAILRGQYFIYQTAHWQTQGLPAYSNHLLFQRLYEGVQQDVDNLAERMVGKFNNESVDPMVILPIMQAWVAGWSQIGCPRRRALQAEADLQMVVKSTYDYLKESDHITLGMDDLLMEIASRHEVNTYLVQQTLRGENDKLASEWSRWTMRGS